MALQRRIKGDITEDTIYISWRGEIDVATLTRCINDAGEEEYRFVVNWDIYDSVPGIYGIRGLNMDLRLPEYVRYETPCFMTEVMPPMNREDVPDLLKKYNLPPDADMWDFMIATKRMCNDNYRVHR